MLRDEGFELTLAARTQERLDGAAAELGANAVVTDVSKENECEQLVAAHRERFGRLDVLVNCAGVGIAGSIEATATKQWDLQFAVNMRGAFVVTREAVPLLKESRGLVVNISSIAGTSAAPGLAAYGAAKAAMIAFTRSLNAELAADGVRATAICPGFVDTRMAAWTGMPSEEMIQPEDCAEIVRSLLRLSPAARVPQVVVERLGS
jgi:NAD(P)-dependent dehydrogenase (short-subunit alcohol dehydrogenase family)